MFKSKRKGVLSLVSITLAMLMQLTTMMPLFARAGATDNIFGPDSPFITSVTLTDSSGNPLGTDVPKNANVKVTYNFSIPNGKNVPAGTTYSITLPKEIALFNEINGNLADSSGDVVATLHVGTDGAGLITFTNFAETHSNVGGTFTINGYFDVGDDENTTPVIIPFAVQGTSQPYTVDVYFAQPDATNSKSGVYDPASGIVTWTVKLNINQTTVNNGEFSDAIKPGHNAPDKSQTYVPGSFKVTVGDGSIIYDSNASSGNSGTFSYTAADSGDTSKTGTLDYTFVNSFSDTRTATFQTKVNDPSQYFGKSISNSAGFHHDGINQTINGSASVPTPNYITKTGTYNTSTQQIDWNVKYNNDGLSLHGVKITDTLTGGLTLATSPDSVKVNDSAVNEGSGTGEYTYNIGTNTLTYNAGDIDTQQTLTFSTSLPTNYWQENHGSNEFSNTATMTSTDNSYLEGGAPGTATGVGVGNSVIGKVSTGYDKETHRITWQIIVNGDKQNLPGASITDVIPAGQKYLPETFTITPGAPANGANGQAFAGSLPDAPSTTATNLTYDFGYITSSYTITYQTEVTDPTVWAGNVNATNNYSNTVTIYPGNSIPSSSTTGYQTVSPTVLDKSVAGYDYTTHEITWKIVVNQDQLPLTDTVVNDVLSGNGMDDFTLETDTIQVDSTSIGMNSSSTPYYSYDGASKTLTFHLGDLDSATAADRIKVITFKTKLNKTGADYNTYFDTNGNHKITNKASLTTTENPASVTDSATETIHNTLVGKTGYYSSGKAFIDWAVEIDQNEIELDNLQLTDTLQQGLSLDTSTVKLYAQALNPNGSYTPVSSYSGGTLSVPGGTSIQLTGENISYDAATRKFVFTMPATVSQPYLLTFRTMVDADYSGTTFSNTISFNGASSGQQSTSGNQPVGFSSSSSSAWGETGNVKVTKEDSATHAGLSGAVFALYDQYGNRMLISDTTGNDGTTSFDHLLFGIPYTVRELTPPANYELSTDSYFFKLNSDGTVQLLYPDGSNDGQPVASLPALQDTRKVGIVSFIKTGDGGAPLAGATFTLCDSDGKPVSGFGSVTTDSTGQVTFSDVPYGSYKIKETSAPTGYLPLSIPFTLDDSNSNIQTSGIDHIVDLGMQQDHPCGSITVTKNKTDYSGGPSSALEGAVFEVLDNTGAQVGQTQQTDSSGQAVFNNLPVGGYTLHEVSAPADYQTVSNHSFTISASDTAAQRQLTYSVTDIKKAGSISFTKTDGTNPLPGAVFTLYDSTGTTPIRNGNGVITATSEKNGVVQFTDVPYGDYIIKETTAPHNFTAMDPITVSLHDSNSGAANLGTVFDSLITGTIQLTKTDGFHALQGAQFTLTGNGITRTTTSDLNGIVQFLNVPYNDNPYTISETQTPAPYYQKTADFQVTLNYLTADSSGKLTPADPVVDVPLGSISLTKTDEDGTTPLSGAVFALYDSGNNLLQTAQPTGSDGNVIFDNLPLNPIGATVYTLREVIAPANYNTAPDRSVTLYNDNGLRDVSGLVVTDTRKTGTIVLTKVDQNGRGLEGATFTLCDSLTGSPIQSGGQPVTAVSDADGHVTFSNIPFGSYIIKETSAPTDYTCSDQTLTADLTDGDPYVLLNTLILTTPVTDSIKTAGIQFTKLGIGGVPLAGATFTLYDSAGDNPVVIGNSPVNATSDADGLVSFQDIPYGDYTIKETAPPADYAPVSPIKVSLHDSNSTLSNGVLTLDNVSDALKLGSITFTKLDENGNVLAGATFVLKDANGNPVGSPQTSDRNGKVTFDSVPYGDGYFITETKSPADYAALSSPITGISLHSPEIVLQSVSDSRLIGSISFTKVDENGKPLTGAEFTLYDADGKQVGSPQISDKDGKVTFINVPYGDGYSITETKSPADYAALSSPITGISLHSPEIVLQSVSDSRLTGSISFTKVDENGRPLAGAEFTLYDADGKQVGSPQISDKDGKVTFTNVPFKDGYTIMETKAPENYAVHTAFTVSLHTNSYDYGKVVDNLLRGSIKVTKTDPSGHPLAGSTFTLYDVNGNAVGQVVSDSRGIAVFADIPYGDYTIRETAAPEGYGIDNDAHEVRLNTLNPVPVIKVIDEKISLTPNPKTEDEKGLPLAEAGALALASGGVILSRKMRFRKHK